MAERDADEILDTWIFASNAAVDCVYARGRLVVRDGAHVARGPNGERFRATMRRLHAD